MATKIILDGAALAQEHGEDRRLHDLWQARDQQL